MKKGDLILVEWDDHAGDDDWQNTEECEIATMHTPCYFVRWTPRALKIAMHKDQDDNFTGHTAFLKRGVVTIYCLSRGKVLWEQGQD